MPQAYQALDPPEERPTQRATIISFLPRLHRNTCSAAVLRYRDVMDHDEPEARGIVPWVRARQHIFIGVAGLIAWLVMLWLMFGDVL